MELRFEPKFYREHLGEKSDHKCLMAWLRKEKYIDSANVAYQRYIEQGIFEVKETVYYVGTTYHTSRKTLITPKGQVYLAKKVSKGYKG